MKKFLTSIFVKTVTANIKNEADSACAFWGYQPKMPESVKRFRKNGKK